MTSAAPARSRRPFGTPTASSSTSKTVTITADGAEATAEVSSKQVGEDVTRTFSLVKEDDEWRIDSFG